MGWRNRNASGEEGLATCSGTVSVPEEDCALPSCDCDPELDDVIVVLVLEALFAGRESTPDNPMPLRKAGADFEIF